MGKATGHRVHVECKPDEALAHALGVPRREIKHWRDKGRVYKHLQDNPGLIGLIDEDPFSAQPSGLGRQRPEEHPEYGLEVIAGSSRLIILCPRLEEWILHAAKEATLDPTRFGLLNQGQDLHDVINLRLKNFKNLLKELQRRDSPRLRELKRLLRI